MQFGRIYDYNDKYVQPAVRSGVATGRHSQPARHVHRTLRFCEAVKRRMLCGPTGRRMLQRVDLQGAAKTLDPVDDIPFLRVFISYSAGIGGE